MAFNRKHILYILPYPPNPIRTRSLSFCKLLSDIHIVDLIYLSNGESIQIPHNISSSFELHNRSSFARYTRIIIGLLKFQPITYQYYNSNKLGPFLAKLDLSVYDLVLVERLPLPKTLLKHPNIALDFVDCFSNQTKLIFKHVKGLKKLLYLIDSFLLPNFEKTQCQLAKHIIVTTSREKSHLEKICDKNHVHAIPHTFSVRTVSPLLTYNNQEKLRLSFHGKLSYIANKLALKELNQIAFTLKSTFSLDFSLSITGSTQKLKTSHFKHLNFLGYVKDLAESVGKSHLSVFPLKVSVGIPNKVLESLSFGIPVLIPENVAAGIDNYKSIKNIGIFIDRIENFPARILCIKDSLMKSQLKIRTNCTNFINTNYNERLILNCFKDLYSN